MASAASLQQLAFEAGALYIADYFAGAVRQVTLPGGVVTDLGGTVGVFPGPATTSKLSYYHSGLAFDASGALYITAENSLLRFGM